MNGDQELVTVLAVCGVAALATLINGYVLLVILLSKRTSSPINVLLTHLSAVDLIICIAVLVSILPEAFNQYEKVAPWLCPVHGFLFNFLHPMAIWTVCGLNCDRYYAIAAPLHYGTLVNSRKIMLGLCGTWIVCLLISLPPVFRLVPYTYQPGIPVCTTDFSKGRATILYSIFYTTISLVLPGVHDRPVSQAPHSVGDIRSDAVGAGDHHAPAEPVLPAHGDGQQAAPEQRVLGRVPNRRLAGRVLSAVLLRVPVRVAVRGGGRGAAHRPGRQVTVVRPDHRFSAVQRSAVRHQEQAAEEDVPELPAEDDDQVRGEPGDPGPDAVGVRVAQAVAHAGGRGRRGSGVHGKSAAAASAPSGQATAATPLLLLCSRRSSLMSLSETGEPPAPVRRGAATCSANALNFGNYYADVHFNDGSGGGGGGGVGSSIRRCYSSTTNDGGPERGSRCAVANRSAFVRRILRDSRRSPRILITRAMSEESEPYASEQGGGGGAAVCGRNDRRVGAHKLSSSAARHRPLVAGGGGGGCDDDDEDTSLAYYSSPSSSNDGSGCAANDGLALFTRLST
ncbi:hypothetical protein AGLY_013226 [Aphis glycines]|uniref:G-protein coupled receptors family 1 profile domain-containing protein n=1 Tax=Aphis glycines TaxID=307491 RepID=A0A6G0T5P5_APHGL|nr:hypothetical protein AGLY_013226 [Aphis glycines]